MPPPHYLLGRGRRRLSPSPLPILCPSPSRPQFPVRGQDDRKSNAHLGPPFSRAGRGASAAPTSTAPTRLRGSGCASRPRHLVAALGRSAPSWARAGRARRAAEWGRTRDGGASGVRRRGWTPRLPRRQQRCCGGVPGVRGKAEATHLTVRRTGGAPEGAPDPETLSCPATPDLKGPSHWPPAADSDLQSCPSVRGRPAPPQGRGGES